MTSVRLRKDAIKYLIRIFHNGAYLNIILSNINTSSKYNPIEKSYLAATLRGVVIYRQKYEWIISKLSKINVKKLEQKILYYLMAGIQNLIGDKLPGYAALDSIVEAVKQEKSVKAAGYVNGVLRAFQRSINNIEYPDKSKKPVQFLSVFYSHPEWMIKRWINRYGFENTEKLCAWNNKETTETTIRINRLKSDSDRLFDFCVQNGITLKQNKDFPAFYSAESIGALIRSEWFLQGYFIIQAVNSSIPVYTLNPSPGTVVYDLCAAPGGKTTLIAEIMQNSGKIVAVDNHDNRLKLIRDNCKRLGISNARFVCDDSSEVNFQPADYILLDVPCSGLGVLNQKSDIRWKKTEKQIVEIVKLQKRLLYNAVKMLKKDGILIYSTCTIEPEENEELVEIFLNDNPDFKLENIDLLQKYNQHNNKPYLNVLPFVHKMDGSFIAKIKRIK
jgi:16S rRNA (cytosine967-C5)-methyltransferase